MSGVDHPIVTAQLAWLDGEWQESPETLATFEQEGGRGALYLVVEVAGESAGREDLTRALIEKAQREYAASRGSITLALTQAMRAANDYFYDFNATTPPEARRIAGMTAAVLRGNDVFIAQAGPGVTCHLRGIELHRYPEASPWFEPNAVVGEFPTAGAVPLGMRRNYTPDLWHISLEYGDTILLATRSLVHLLTNEELMDTVANRDPNTIVESLEDIAGSSDLSAMVLRFSGDAAPKFSPDPIFTDSNPIVALPADAYRVSKVEPPAPNPEDQARARRARERRANFSATLLSASAAAVASLARIFSGINWGRIGTTIDNTISLILRGLARVLAFSVRAFLPGEPKPSDSTPLIKPSPKMQSAWRLATLALPVLLIGLGSGASINYWNEVDRAKAAQFSQFMEQANAAYKNADSLSRSDKNAARDAALKAQASLQQAKTINPNSAAVRTLSNQVQDLLDSLGGVSIVFSIPTFANYSDPKAKPARIIAHGQDVFVFDRGMQRIYQYRVDEVGSNAAPIQGDGVILKSGDKTDNRAVGELVDITWLDSGKLVAVDRSGAFLSFDPTRSTWATRAATDAAKWARVNLLTSYEKNLYLVEPATNQILRYVAPADGLWSSSVTYFLPGVNVDMSATVDFAIDNDVWVLRKDGAIWRFNAGKQIDFKISDLETPLSNPVSIVTSSSVFSLYVADAGNQRIVQLDKVTGKFQRQFKPRTQERDAFNALKLLAVDDSGKKFVFVNGNAAHLATIPQ